MCAAQFHGERSSSFRLVVERAGPEPDPAGCRDHATSDTLRGRREPEHRRYAASALAMPRRNRRSPPSSARGQTRPWRHVRVESVLPPTSDIGWRGRHGRKVPQEPPLLSSACLRKSGNLLWSCLRDVPKSCLVAAAQMPSAGISLSANCMSRIRAPALNARGIFTMGGNHESA
jgi:hypothetical protein